jgi:hypothetical protein
LNYGGANQCQRLDGEGSGKKGQDASQLSRCDEVPWKSPRWFGASVAVFVECPKTRIAFWRGKRPAVSVELGRIHIVCCPPYVFFCFHAFFAPAGVHNQDGMKCCADLVETFMVNRFGCIMLVKMWHFVAFGNPKRTIS